MPVPPYMDVHVPQAITDQLRRRGIDVLTAIEDSAGRLPDDQLLGRALAMGRLVFTQDIRFMALAEQWQRGGRDFAGLVFGHQMHGTIGQFVQDLELVATASDLAEWRNVVERLPF